MVGGPPHCQEWAEGLFFLSAEGFKKMEKGAEPAGRVSLPGLLAGIIVGAWRDITAGV